MINLSISKNKWVKHTGCDDVSRSNELPLLRSLCLIQSDIKKINTYLDKLEKRKNNDRLTYEKFTGLRTILNEAISIIKLTDEYINEIGLFEKNKNNESVNI